MSKTEQAVPKRSYPNDPTPMETLGYIADAISELVEAHGFGPSETYESWMSRVDSITLGEVKNAVAERMAKAKIGRGRESEAFSSAYRHEEMPEHALVLRMLTSTVEMNARIGGIAIRSAAKTEVPA